MVPCPSRYTVLLYFHTGEVIPIAIDWNAIRAEYIGGGISKRKLAAKYDITYAALRNKAETEGWLELREEAQRKSNAPFGLSALEKSWSAIAFLPVLSAIAETVIETVITPVSKRVAYSVKRQQTKDGIR